jgi:hypothetical protein
MPTIQNIQNINEFICVVVAVIVLIRLVLRFVIYILTLVEIDLCKSDTGRPFDFFLFYWLSIFLRSSECCELWG